MPCIYDLDNEYGARIITDSGTGAPALEVENLAPGYPAVAIYSTVSASPLHVREITFGGGGALFQSAVTYSNALTVGRTIPGNSTTAPLAFANLSMASVPVIDFGNNFVSVASICLAATATITKAVVVRAGSINYALPLVPLVLLNGAGAYA